MRWQKKLADGGEVTAATTIHNELMKTTFILSQHFGVTPFEIMAQDIDEVIIVINYLCEIGNTGASGNNNANILNEKEQDKNFWACL